MTAKHWWVYSPEMTAGGDGYEPPEPWCEVASVEAETPRAAIRLALPKLKAWTAEARGDGRNPFVGVTAEPAECPHGVCTCNLAGCAKAGDVCDACVPPEPS